MVSAPQAIPTIDGVISTRQAGALTWRQQLLSDGNSRLAASSLWTFAFADSPDDSLSLKEALQNGSVDDILVVFTFSGLGPAWD